MSKLISYIIAIVGLLLISISNDKLKNSLNIMFLSEIPSIMILVPGLIAVGIGVFLLTRESKKGKSYPPKQEKEEVPIYRGEGKNRKIVAYKRE